MLHKRCVLTIITLTTDFGYRDGFVGMMKGVIWGICPSAQIVDLSHDIAPQNVAQGALLLGRAARYFGAGSVHVAVVDPGVGTDRRGLAARIGGQYFVGPDNGLCTPLVEAARRAGEECVFAALDNPVYWLPNVSRTFHGRDVFAPAAAHLACGLNLEALGTVISDPVLKPLPAAQKTADGWLASVIAVDAFGNLATNLSWNEALGGSLTIHIKGRVIKGLSTTFGEHAPGELIALVDSDGQIAIAQVNGSAARVLAAGLGEAVEVRFEDGGYN